ncbi:hypothetical protein [Tepidiforma thermophila]|uniref:Uncharacterized protein n=1 Tax=Tepidiforma thermophila (strain KCTC 52669 / CGMCC 1.13589 / G233) TaxID=2761530 RepID=A0A2A9HDS9_TEPT2|nr:hypothetical protein [Tepidiforma thermophila]PFG73165.1 hypothetical protein A9A59_0360 [Tepidiforma thermophila]
MLRTSAARLLVAGLAALLILPLAAACGGSDDDEHAGDTAAVLAAVTFLDGAGYHDIDDAINKDRTVPATARTAALKGQAVVKATAWPAELQPKADALAGILGDLAAALEGDSPDLAKAGAAAKKAHDAQHEFSDAAWGWLYEKAGVKGPAHGH